MSWERRLLDLFDDLEQQAEGAALVARDAEVAELARAEYSEVDLASRLHASLDRLVELSLRDGLVVRGRMSRVGDGWCLVCEAPERPPDGQEWLVALSAIATVRGLSAHAQPSSVQPVTGRLGLGSALRRVAEELVTVTFFLVDGRRRQGRLGRVGKDFVELVAEGGVEVVPFSGVAAVRR